MPITDLPKKAVRRFRLITAMEVAGGATLSFWLGALISDAFGLSNQAVIGGLWAMISTVLVSSVIFKEVLHNALDRVIGSFVGAVVSVVVFTLLSYTYYALVISLFFTVLICASLTLTYYRLAGITVGVIFAVSKISGGLAPWLNASLRFIESCVGVIVPIVIASLLYFFRKRYGFFQKL